MAAEPLDDAALDALLLSVAGETPSPALRAAVIAAAPGRPRPACGWIGWGLGWAAAGVAGLMLGAMLELQSQTDQSMAEALPAAMLDLELGERT